MVPVLRGGACAAAKHCRGQLPHPSRWSHVSGYPDGAVKSADNSPNVARPHQGCPRALFHDC